MIIFYFNLFETHKSQVSSTNIISQEKEKPLCSLENQFEMT